MGKRRTKCYYFKLAIIVFLFFDVNSTELPCTSSNTDNCVNTTSDPHKKVDDYDESSPNNDTALHDKYNSLLNWFSFNLVIVEIWVGKVSNLHNPYKSREGSRPIMAWNTKIIYSKTFFK